MSMKQIQTWLAMPLLFAFLGCGRKPLQSVEAPEAVHLNDEQISRLENMKIFFGHQSVGADVVQGIRDLMEEDHRLRLNLVTSTEPQAVSGPAFVESPIGENRNPHSKDKAFADILARGMGLQGGIAMYKYCYIDIDLATDVGQLFESYRQEIVNLKTKYPSLIMVLITVPLTTDDQSLKTRIKTMIGRPTSRDVNLKRNQFNVLLREHFAGEPIFDLAQVESTHPDGSRSYVIARGECIYTLASEFTTDGGHLNRRGRRRAAEQLLLLLAHLS
jgi:hypothetical protein